MIDHIRSTYDFQSHEYCQYFAATLQMANEGKVVGSLNPYFLLDFLSDEIFS